VRDVSEALAWDHDRLEEIEAAAFEARARGDAAAAREGFALFAHGLTRHIRFEEEILFPEFEARSGLGPEAGPTAVMRMEHRQIEALLDALARAVGEPGPRADALRRELQDVLGDHNVKEEEVLYPATDRMLSAVESDELVARIQAS
jgi:hemerythrin superfamily protein